MGGSTHQVSPDGARNKGIAELNKDKHDDENKDVRVIRDGMMGEGQELSDEDESRINESAMDMNMNMNDGPEGAVAPLALQAGLQKQQQQQQHWSPPGPVFLWERILPVRTLKVLLVENDDSTRQIVSALLRNCSYEVTATANGLQAWKILENPTNHIDLVLTEVVMPGLSGIGLLSKIMIKDTCKNIPVIMMSSNDSMGTVFKCLSKGAVDFLVKPIRKNELKNLWQHVWRRSHSSSGSVSESGIQTQKSAKSRSDDSDNNSSSNDEDDNASIDLNARDGSDHGSGTQSSWTKHAVEVDSPQPMSPSDQLGDPHDSTCAQVISDSEIFCNKWLSMTATRECPEQKKHADEFMGKDLEIRVPRNAVVPTETMSANQTGKGVDKHPESVQNDEDMLGLESSSAFNEPSSKAANLIGGIDSNSDVQLLTRVTESKDKINGCSKGIPSLHLSLKKSRSTGEGGSAIHEERYILRRSDQSAFSRYRTSAASTQALTGCFGSCSPVDNSSEAVKTESTQNIISNSNPATLKQGSNGSSDNNDKGSTTKNVFTNSPVAVAKSIHLSAFHLVQPRTSPQTVHEKIDDQSGGTQYEYQVQHHHHHYHHHHHHVQQLQQQPAKAFVVPVEGNAANYSQNGSNSGSNHGSNAQNANNGVNMETTNVVEKCGPSGGNGSGSGSGSGSGVDQSRLTQREVALNKFRQKRKERNFGKKVRYQSRKRLAEQRPRVRGQFVRQGTQENTSREADS